MANYKPTSTEVQTSKGPHPTLRLIIESSPENVALVTACMGGLCSLTPLNEVATYEVKLCVAEVINNVIKHAYISKPHQTVEIRTSLLPQSIEIEVCDTGNYQDLGSRINLNKYQNADPCSHLPKPINLSEGGMGLSIVKQVMDEIRHFQEQGTNRFFMKKHFNQLDSESE